MKVNGTAVIKYSDAAGIVVGAPREYGIDVFGARAQLDF
jgi:hypothetical protein